MPFLLNDVRLVETDMSKGRDTQSREGKKKPEKTLKEKRATKAAKKAGTTPSDGVNKALVKRNTSR